MMLTFGFLVFFLQRVLASERDYLNQNTSGQENPDWPEISTMEHSTMPSNDIEPSSVQVDNMFLQPHQSRLDNMFLHAYQNPENMVWQELRYQPKNKIKWSQLCMSIWRPVDEPGTVEFCSYGPYHLLDNIRFTIDVAQYEVMVDTLACYCEQRFGIDEPRIPLFPKNVFYLVWMNDTQTYIKLIQKRNTSHLIPTEYNPQPRKLIEMKPPVIDSTRLQ